MMYNALVNTFPHATAAAIPNVANGEATRWSMVYEGDEAIGPVGPRHVLVQNEDVRRTVETAVEAAGMDIHQRILFHYPGRARMIYTFKDLQFWDDSQKGGRIGIMVENSVNGRRSLTVGAYAFRLVCKNGMAVGDLLTDSRMRLIHKAGADASRELYWASAKRTIEDYIAEVGTRTGHLQAIIERAMETPATVEQIESLAPMMRRDADLHNEWLRVSLQQSETVWELYNRVTHAYSHGERGLGSVEQGERLAASLLRPIAATVA